MNMHHSHVSNHLLDRVSHWLKQSALNGDDLETVVTGFCERLAAAGLPLNRIHLSFSMLHPLYDALGFTWLRGQGVTVEGYRAGEHEDDSNRFLKSPYYYLLSNSLEHLRRQITPETPDEFPIFEELKAMGTTDYIAFVQSFGEASGQGMIGSWSTDAPGGFSDDIIEALLRIQNSLAVAAKMAVLGKLADNMLTTYLGANSGKRVLSGQIRRGDGETIRAALVMADMRQSTMLAEREGRQVYIDTLNEFFDAIATPFNRDGGEILSFLGDGFLAVYPCGRHREPSQVAVHTAMNAVRQATARMAQLNDKRRGRNLGEIHYGIGLHVGNVMFGNVGLKDRLTFSAFGSAVNEVQRLQGLTKKYNIPIVASQSFAGYCGGDWQTLGDEKLRGVRQKVTLLTPSEAHLKLDSAEAMLNGALETRSEAEQVMLLYHNTRRPRGGSLWNKLLQ
ncbi:MULTISPECIES: adenylate/guanylate cyclase domain-containing protein [unclassified Rhizobium]|uniref:adenylate/guanylate cyclase domain-containing protein n=1 Tax=unclassified Rhizobium TaxID=2613769 RepID=UPI0006F97110|nr:MULTISPECIES: adenylate/guanylate cyclase domain-containing protein [unclassified Rhizobium]KQV38079.1 adenylate cyclase [Rhizobium sp. Root1212]KRD30735.1 adenylate cyclase [Rhizobium sp. Root268]